MKRITAVALFALTTSFFARAEYIEHPYVGLDYQMARATNVNEAKIGSVLVRTGTNIYKYLGVEAQASYGVKEGDFTATAADGTTSNYSVKNRGSYGLYLKPVLPLGPKAEAYALIGGNYSDYKIDQTGQNSYGASFSYGAGVNVYPTPKAGIGVEYMRYDKDIKALNVGGRYRF